MEVGRVARLVGLQFYEEAAPAQGVTCSAEAFARWLAGMLQGQGEEVVLDTSGKVKIVEIAEWRLIEDLGIADPASAFSAWNELWTGACAAHDRFLGIEVTHTKRVGAIGAQWRIVPQDPGQ